ncbi:MAG: hypothetical protein E7370_01655 [Clostridiales bacterium]|nr:hypothetical protein [Clostridiales bacterium]
MLKVKNIICLAMCLIICSTTLFFINFNNEADAEKIETIVLNLWQIDNFEGGKGSRASFIKNIGEKYYNKSKVFIKVTAISAESARINLNNGVVPDIISYGAGMYGIEKYVFDYQTWCYGAYCLLTLDNTADFLDINNQNCVINKGTGNFSSVAAAFCGLSEATFLQPTNAYLELINGKYKYLLGTQRDIFRLKTRETDFSYKIIDEFSDIFQNISVTAKDEMRKIYAKNFINFFINNLQNVSNLGLFNKKFANTEEELADFYKVEFKYSLKTAINKNFYDEILNCVNEKDLNKLKLYLNN